MYKAATFRMKKRDSHLVIAIRNSGFPDRVLEILCPVSESRHSYRSVLPSSVSISQSIALEAPVSLDCRKEKNETFDPCKKRKRNPRTEDSGGERERQRLFTFFQFCKNRAQRHRFNGCTVVSFNFFFLLFSFTAFSVP